MRKLRTPPLISASAFERVFPALGRPDVRQYVADANREYRHWEKLRHLPTPQGLTPEEAWGAVKLSRMGSKRILPLCDVGGVNFSYWLPDPALAILHEVDRWGGSTLAVAEGTHSALGPMRDRVVVSSL